MLSVSKIDKKFMPDNSRVIVKPYIPADEERILRIINSVLSLDEKRVDCVLEKVVENFGTRHLHFWDSLENTYNEIKKYLPENIELSNNRKMLLSTYFSCEYSIQGAAFFNPSIVAHPIQENVPEGGLRFILSFRAVGEGHISSIEFRSGIIDKNLNFTFDPVSKYAQRGIVSNKKLYDSNYEISFKPNQDLSEKIIFPASKNESNGIEDARFVRFVDDDGSVTYYATYTAYNGRNILPQLIETKDFAAFKMMTLGGGSAKNKGMALFPRKINGKYMMVSRTDGETLYLMTSDNMHFWHNAQLLKKPENEWELMQIGNCGSPIETEHGWLLLTHGVGPMREYSIGAILLDIEKPNKIIGNMRIPLLTCNQDEREGYVPNVVYSCGSIIHNDNLIIPYAMSDTCSGIATIPTSELFKHLLE